MINEFKKEYFIQSSQSPWKGFTGSYEEEQAGKTIEAVVITRMFSIPVHLQKYIIDYNSPLAIDRLNKKVYVNDIFFSTLHRADATRAETNEKQIIGAVKDSRLMNNPAFLFSFLIESQIIETYWHVEATVSFINSDDTAALFSARFHGRHVYFTNEKNEQEYDFSIYLNKKTGELWITG
ncbi:MAG: hypothetical protein JW904_05320 [Spirochaetales bacterium]|nr:hypothetical protein [Spirochaetales bacterium]